MESCDANTEIGLGWPVCPEGGQERLNETYGFSPVSQCFSSRLCFLVSDSDKSGNKIYQPGTGKTETGLLAASIQESCSTSIEL